MIEPSFAVQRAIFGALDGALKSGDAVVPILDRVPDAQQPPYVSIGEDQVIPDKAEGFERSAEIVSTLHVFYYGGSGRAGAKTIVGQIVDRMESAELWTGPDYTALITLHEGTRYLEEPDGRTIHAVVTSRTLLDAA